MAKSNDHVHDLDTAVDEQFGVVVRDSHAFEDNVEVVGSQSISRPLREQTQGEQDEESASVAHSLEEHQPAITLELLLKCKCFLDLLDLQQHDLIIEIAVCVSLGKDAVSLLGFALGEQVTRTLRDEPDKDELKDWSKALKYRWDSPRPVAVNLVCAIGRPSCDDSTHIPCGVVNCREDSAMLWVNEFRDQQRAGSLCDRRAESNEESSPCQYCSIVYRGCK